MSWRRMHRKARALKSAGAINRGVRWMRNARFNAMMGFHGFARMWSSSATAKRNLFKGKG